jgi:hypothetical protein
MHAIGRIGRGAIAAGLLAALAASLPVALACPIGPPRVAASAGDACSAAATRLGCTLADRHFVPATESGCATTSCAGAAGTCASDGAGSSHARGSDTGSTAGGTDGRAWCYGDPSSATRPASFGLDAAPPAPVTIEPFGEPARWAGVRAIAAERVLEPPPRARPPTRAPPYA